MAVPAFTYTFINGQTINATQVMANYNTLLNAITDGTGTLSFGSLTLGTALTVGNGGTGLSAVPTSPNASGYTSWNGNRAVLGWNVLLNTTSTATAAGTSNIAGGAKHWQFFTGSTTQTVVMGDATGLTIGQSWTIHNYSSGVVTVQTFTGTTIQAMAANTALRITCIDTAGNTLAAWGWTYEAIKNSGLSGTVTSVDMSVPAFLSVAGNPITTNGTLALTLSGTALPVLNGGTAKTSVTVVPAATSWAGWDANINLSANSMIDGYRTTATAAGTTTLLVGDAKTQYFTGSTTQTCKLPVTSTLVNGQEYTIVNLSSGLVTVQSSGANTLQIMSANTMLKCTVISTSGTGTSSWNWTYSSVQNATTGGSAITVQYNLNYIGNPDAETGTTGWATYADAAAATPVDMTGGAPNSTWTQSATSPLRGTYSFLWTKSANNRQGEGVSYDFTIASSDQGKMLQIQFDWALVSGTWAGSVTPGTNSDMTVWVYDVTNSTLIMPSGNLLDTAVTGQFYRYKGTFQTAINSTSYRVGLYTATASASAYTLKLDSVSVAPVVMASGAAITDWSTYTPTSVGTNVTHSGNWRRVGDSMEIVVDSVFSAASGAFSQVTYAVPSGYTIDTTKLPSSVVTTNALGIGSILDNGVKAYSGVLVYNSSTTVELRYFVEDGSGSGVAIRTDPVTNTAPFTFNNTDHISARFTVPIVGWSSNVQMSNDTDSRIVDMKATSTQPTGTLNTTLAGSTAAIFGTTAKDSHGGYNSTTGQYTIPVAGDYNASGQVIVSLTTPSVGDDIQAGVYIDSTLQQVALFRVMSTTTTSYPIPFDLDLPNLTAGNVITVRISSSAGTRAFLSAAGFHYFQIKRLSGPSQIAATDSVNCRYYASATGISGSLATISWTTKDFDSHGGMSSGTYTVPIAGKYQVNSYIGCTGTYALNSLLTMEIQKNGTAVSRTKVYSGGVETQLDGGVVDIVSCVAGDTLRIQVSNSGTGPAIVSSNFENYISIARLGN